MKTITNEHCLSKGHFWKLRLGGWICDHCRNHVSLPWDAKPNQLAQTKPDKWLGIKKENCANV